MLRAHYRETPKLQAGRSRKGKDNRSKEGREEEKERKRTRVGQVYHEYHVEKTISQNTGIPKQYSRDCNIEYSRLFFHRTLSSDWQRMGFYEVPTQFFNPTNYWVRRHERSYSRDATWHHPEAPLTLPAIAAGNPPAAPPEDI